MSEHPFPKGQPYEPGTRVRHVGQNYHTAHSLGTATVVEAVRNERGWPEYVVEVDRPVPGVGETTRQQWDATKTHAISVYASQEEIVTLIGRGGTAQFAFPTGRALGETAKAVVALRIERMLEQSEGT